MERPYRELTKMRGFHKTCVVKLWKSLPQDYIKAKSLQGFKRNQEKFKEEKSMESFKIYRNVLHLKKNLY